MGIHDIYRPIHWYTREEEEHEKAYIKECMDELDEFDVVCRCGNKCRLTDKEIEKKVEERFYETDNNCYDDEIMNLKNRTVPGTLIVMEDDGDYKILKGSDLSDILSELDKYGTGDTWVYVNDKDQDIHFRTPCCGVNSISGIIRYIPDGDSDKERDAVETALYEIRWNKECNKTKQWAIVDRHTKRLGREIQNIYGYGKLPKNWKSKLYKPYKYSSVA